MAKRSYLKHKDGADVYWSRGELRWRTFRRGRNTGNGGESYKRKAALLRGMRATARALTAYLAAHGIVL